MKSALLLIATLAIGVVLGALLNARLAQQRLEEIAFMRGPGGFSRTMERAITPLDDEQRDAIRDILESAEARVREQSRTSRAEMAAIIDSTNEELRAILSAEQLERLERRLEFRRRGRLRPNRTRQGNPGDGPPNRRRRP
ncbi:MAG: hypothetical protein HKN13_01370 [Rhodothermales bacterium]|nr:hypothetical protein [Rhodothermales bacterium]